MAAFLDGDFERAQSHFENYERTGVAAELEAAVTGFRMLAMSTLDGPVANGLAIALWSRFERSGRRADLNEAIGLLRHVARRYPDDPQVLASLSNLAGTLRQRWRVTGAQADLAESVEISRRVVESTAVRHPMRAARVSNLADGLQALYLQHNDTSALDEAIALFRDALNAVEASSSGHDLAAARANLAQVLRMRFQSSRDVAMLDEAVVLARAAVDQVTSPLLQARFQSTLAIILIARYTATGRVDDLHAAERLAKQALKSTPPGHPNRAERANVVAAAMQRLDHRSRSGQRQVARAAAAAVEATPVGHPARAGALNTHGHTLFLQGDHDGAVLRFRQVAEGLDLAPRQRVAAARHWANVELWRGDWDSALSPLRLAVELLPHTAPRRVTHADREQALGEFAGLARDAAACAIHGGDARLAVGLLEVGRGVILGHALDARTDLTDLHEQHPDLARRFDEVRTALDRPEGETFVTRMSADQPLVAGTSQAQAVTPRTPAEAALTGEQRHALAEEWQGLVTRIRAQPGFRRFLEPPSVDEILEAADRRGTVVIVNVSGLRCDALLLRSREVVVVRLEKLTLSDCAANAALLRTGAPDAVEQVLDWLAVTVTGPVMRALGLAGAAPRPELPRLWWIPTGPLAALPLHAAGDVPDLVVSSYAPTLRSLLSAWSAPTVPRGPRDPLVVAVPSVPGAAGIADLPAVRPEAEELARKFPDAQVLDGDQAVRATVLDALPRHRWAHFACHASTAAGFASGSLVLYDYATAPLAVADIARLRLTDADLAYLSACETNRSPDDLADEMLHIAGAFHMAGFRNVIGTLWPVRDSVARTVADHFYAALVTASTPARALNAAARELRRTSPASAWAAFLHVGG